MPSRHGCRDPALRELVDRPQHVAGLEVEQRPLGDPRVVVDRDAHVVAAGVHVREQPADVLADQVGLQRPGRVGVADREREVRHAAEHHALVGHRLRQPHRLAVHAQLDAAERSRFSPVAVTTMSASSSSPDSSRTPVSVKVSIRSVTTEARPSPDRLEQVAVGHQAQPLVPRVVARLEVGVDVVAVGQLLDRHLPDPAADHVGPAPAEPVDQRGQRDVLPAGDRVGEPRAEQRAQPVGDRILGRQGQDVAGRALQHRHVRRRLGHRRHQRHRGRAAADHHDPLARVVEVLRPVLRVDDLPAEVLDAGELRQVALVVAVVAAAHQQEAAGERRLSRRRAVTASTVQRACSLDQAARVTRWPKRICCSIPASAAVSRT